MTGENTLRTDESRWPIVVHETIGVPPESDVRRMLIRSDAYLARQEPYVVVFDNTHSGKAPKYLRTAAVDWLKANSDELERHCLGTALVIRSPALRFVMATVQLLTQRSAAEVFASRDEAIRWAEMKLVEAGLPIPAAPRDR